MELRFDCLIILVVAVQQALTNPKPQNYQRSYGARTIQDASLRERLDNQSQKLSKKPIITTLNDTKECGDTFCTADPNYPTNFISALDLERYEHLFGDDYIDHFSVRFDADESGLCQSRKRLIHPKRGQTVQNNWYTIINDDKYRQGVLIEECSNAHLPCEYSQNFPLGVESKCKQQYVYRNLLAINEAGKPVMEHFQFPSCCKCMVSSSRSYNQRFGGGGAGSDDELKDRLILA